MRCGEAGRNSCYGAWDESAARIAAHRRAVASSDGGASDRSRRSSPSRGVCCGRGRSRGRPAELFAPTGAFLAPTDFGGMRWAGQCERFLLSGVSRASRCARRPSLPSRTRACPVSAAVIPARGARAAAQPPVAATRVPMSAPERTRRPASTSSLRRRGRQRASSRRPAALPVASRSPGNSVFRPARPAVCADRGVARTSNVIFNRMVEHPRLPRRIFHALVDRTRRAMLAQPCCRGTHGGRVAQPFDMSFTGASKHVKVLEEVGLLRREVQGRHHVCRLSAARLTSNACWCAGPAGKETANERLQIISAPSEIRFDVCCQVRSRMSGPILPMRGYAASGWLLADLCGSGARSCCVHALGPRGRRLLTRDAPATVQRRYDGRGVRRLAHRPRYPAGSANGRVPPAFWTAFCDVERR